VRRLPGSDLDTAYVWVVPGVRDHRATAHRLLVGAGTLLLGRSRSAIIVRRAGDGRPVLNDGELQVSVSHCRAGGLVAVAASRTRPVGVDVECRRAVRAAALARRWFEPAAVDWVQSRPEHLRAEAFLLLWTAKEAVGKARGVGLRGGGLRRRMPEPAPGDPGLHSLPGDDALWVGHPDVRSISADAVLAVAVGGAAHDGDPRSAETSRTSLPVVVRGN
jgi:4'-phosphopantetheinyl transferase